MIKLRKQHEFKRKEIIEHLKQIEPLFMSKKKENIKTIYRIIQDRKKKKMQKG